MSYIYHVSLFYQYVIFWKPCLPAPCAFWRILSAGQQGVPAVLEWLFSRLGQLPLPWTPAVLICQGPSVLAPGEVVHMPPNTWRWSSFLYVFLSWTTDVWFTTTIKCTHSGTSLKTLNSFYLKWTCLRTGFQSPLLHEGSMAMNNIYRIGATLRKRQNVPYTSILQW